MNDDTTRHDPDLDETENLPAIPAQRAEAERIASRQEIPAGASVVIPSGQYPAAYGGGYPAAGGYGGAPMQHPAYNPFLPDYLAPLYDHDAPLQVPLLLETIRRYHLWQAPTCIAYSALGWWTHSEPMHTWLMLPFLAGGVALPIGAYLAHHKHGQESDKLLTRGLLIGSLVGLAGAASVGAGFSGISAMTTFLLAAASTLAGVGWRQHRLQAVRDFVVDHTAAAMSHTPAPAPPGPPAGQPLPNMSHEEWRLHEAFRAMRIEPIRVEQLTRTGNDTFTATIILPPGTNTSPQRVAARWAQLATNLRCRHVEVVPGENQTVLVTVFDGRDQLVDGIPMPTDALNTSFEQPVTIGCFENLDPVVESFLWNHTLIAGATDNGKSGVMNTILCQTLACQDLVRIGADCKPGAPELGPYRRVFHYLADNPDDAMRMLRGIQNIIKARGKFLESQSIPSELNEEGIPVKKWRREFGPYISVPIDELAELTREVPESTQVLESIRQLARYVGIHLLEATQSPGRKVFGGRTDPRQQFQIRIGLRCPEATAINLIFGTGAQSRGWNLQLLKHKGSFMIASRLHEHPRPARGFWVSDEQIARLVNHYAAQVPQLDDLSAQAFEEAFEEDEDTDTPPPGPPNRPGRGRDDSTGPGRQHDGGRRLRVVQQYPDGTPVPAKYRALWELLVEAGRAGATPSELSRRATIAGHTFSSESWVRKAVRVWDDLGHLESEKESREWRYWPKAASNSAAGRDDQAAG